MHCCTALSQHKSFLPALFRRCAPCHAQTWGPGHQLCTQKHSRCFKRMIPLKPKPLQGYLMWTGVVVAYIFTSIPAWTTWVLLVAMALYDLFAVLTPHGPLQMLVNLAVEREQDIPALVYEAREVRRPRRRQANSAAAAGHPSRHDSAAPHAPAGAHPVDGVVEEDAPERPTLRMGSSPAGAIGEATEEGIQMRDISGAVPGGAVLGPGWPAGSPSGATTLSHELARLHRPPVRAATPTPSRPVLIYGLSDRTSAICRL